MGTNYKNNLAHLTMADPNVFTEGYSRVAQSAKGLQPILVYANGTPIDGMPRKFIGQPFEYRGIFYASVNPDYPDVYLTRSINGNGVRRPICCKQQLSVALEPIQED